MDLTQEDVLQILRIMDESDYGELHLKVGELKLDINKHGNPGLSQGEQNLPVPVPADVPKNAEKPVQSDSPAGKSGSIDDAPMTDEAYASEGLIPVRSPMLGTFYTSPKPGDPAFVEEGQFVDEDTTVCIIEVMKLFSTIHAGVKGRITKICANDSQMVEYDQVLFLIDPQADQGEG
jgi:acetyl-CoA carboxylase biotin carboxyl carrier protein